MNTRESILSGRKIIPVDCRSLPPPEPLLRVLEHADALQPDEAVLMLHRMEPCLLFPKLEARGMQYLMEKNAEGEVEVLIWREGS